MRAISILLTAAIFALSSCSEDNLTDSDGMPNNSKSPDEEQDDKGWLIPVTEVRDGGPGKGRDSVY